MKLAIWWHEFRGHLITTREVTVPMWDPWSTGILVKCDCGKMWAR